MHEKSHIVKSADGVSIQYEVQGNGTPALVFVHGWCCSRRFWDQQVDFFARRYTVVTLDLAGHGASGRDRAKWTMEAFGGDMAAVARELGLERVVLIGHSMGAAVIIEAARQLPTSVIGLVGVDTWHDLEHALTSEQIAEFLAPFRADFAEETRAFVRNMFVLSSDAALVEDIVTAMSATPPHIGIAAGEQVLAYDRVMQGRLREVNVPKIAISADWRAVDMEAVQRCGVEVVLMSGVGHFVMMEDPETFNRLLDEAVKELAHSRTRN